MPAEYLQYLQKAVIWRDSGLFYKLFNLNDGIRMYMRSYFTVKYGNSVLGLVYIGAAILIIIVGLRGLKFIPPSQPSLVLMALGLEFTLLMVYAMNLMYSKEDEQEGGRIEPRKSESLLNLGDFDSSREIESLLRVFIKSGKSKKKQGKK